MYFIIGLPKTQNNFNGITVVVDRLTKIAHFIPTLITITAYGVAKLFIRIFFQYHRIPREIINDRDCKFVSEYYITLLKLWGTKIKLSNAYYHETDEQTKRTNRTFENILRMYVGKKQRSWDKWLHMIRFSYNDHIHSDIGISPFHVYMVMNVEPQLHFLFS